jgi:hypothetical protein
MPLGTPQPITIFPVQINVPTEHLFITVQIQSDGTPEGNTGLETVPQELIDLLQEWEGRTGDVNGQLYNTALVTIYPTNPDFVPPPEEEP